MQDSDTTQDDYVERFKEHYPTEQWNSRFNSALSHGGSR